MQRDNRGTIASLMPQIGLPRPSSNLGFAGERPVLRRPHAEPSSGRSPANPKFLDGLGKPIWGVREAIVPLLSLCIPLLYPYSWKGNNKKNNFGPPFWLCNLCNENWNISAAVAATPCHKTQKKLHQLAGTANTMTSQREAILKP